MLDPELKTACDAIYEWCGQESVPYDIVCDEDDIQGILIFKRYHSLLPQCLHRVRTQLEGLHVEQVPVRAGTVLLLSIQALNESDIASAVEEAAVRTEFQYRIHNIFDGALPTTPVAVTETPAPLLKELLLASARSMREEQAQESQHQFATNALSRSTSTNFFKKSMQQGLDGQRQPAGSTEGPHLKAHHGGRKTPAKPASEIPAAIRDKEETRTESHALTMDDLRALANPRREEFLTALDTVLTELAPAPGAAPPPAPPGGATGLQGVGAEHQPGDLFQRFAQAMQALGQQMHLGAPLQDLLKKQGINWKKSEDGQAIIFYVQNAQTNAPQPIARIGYQTLGKPQEFQIQLANMMDFAKGQAPGTEQQKYEEAQEMQKQMRALANQFAPPQDGQGAPGAAQQPAMVAPQAAQPAAAPAAPAKPAAPGPAKPPAAGPAKPMHKPMHKPAPGPGPARPV